MSGTVVYTCDTIPATWEVEIRGFWFEAYFQNKPIVVHACNPSYSEGEGMWDINERIYLENKLKAKVLEV
jgi:hypothetical protein